MKNKDGLARIGLPVAVIVTVLIGLGSHQQKILTNESEIEKKVDVSVYQSDKEANSKDHDRILKNQEIMQADIKEILKK